jgi:enoyl-CoA hydratase
LGQPEILLGIIPGAGGTQRLTRLIGNSRAKDLIFTGRFVAAAEALSLGLVNEVVEPAQVFERALELATALASGPGTAMKAAKNAIDVGGEQSLTEGLLTEQKLFASLFDTQDQIVGMKSFIENGPGKAEFN